MKAMAASGLRGGDQRRRVVVPVEPHHLAVAKRPEVGLRRVADLACLPGPPRGRPSHGDVVAFHDEMVSLVMDHLPIGEQASPGSTARSPSWMLSGGGGPRPWFAPSTGDGDREVEQWRVLLGPEDVALARATARPLAADGE